MIDTQNLLMPLGKHRGERVTRIPVNYLNWAYSVSMNAPIKLKDNTVVPFHKVAKAEIERRGERVQDFDVSAHAIDRLSLKFLRIWQETRKEDEGIYAWAQRMVSEAYKLYTAAKSNLAQPVPNLSPTILEEKNKVTVELHGIKWVIQTDLAIPVLLTAK